MSDESNTYAGKPSRSGVVRLEDLERLRRSSKPAPDGPVWERVTRAEPPRPRRQSTRDLIARIPGIVAELRRDGPVTKTAVYVRLGVDAGTLNEWIARGYVDWKSTTSEPRRPK